MTTYSLAQLTEKMQGKSITLGWDAVVFMNRAKVNSLLEQQYITRFNRDSFMKRISGSPSMVPDGSEVLELSGLIMSQPRLSFEKASLRDSRVTATMDIVSGTVSYMRKGSNQEPGAVLYSYGISASQGYTLTMDINLAASSGTVNEQGRVVVDIGDGYNCVCNLVQNDNSQKVLGDFFKALFLEQKPEDRVYELGMLDLRDVDLLAPRSFIIRTMATDEGKDRNADDYGEGAVVLCVRTKGNPKDGDEPSESSMDYLIPNDRDPQTGKALYSGALVLASRVMFDWYIQGVVENQVGNGLRFIRFDQSNYVARKLVASSGSFSLPGAKLFREVSAGPIAADSYEVTSVGPRAIEFAGVTDDGSLQVIAESGNCRVGWDARSSQKYNREYVHRLSGIVTKRENTEFYVHALPKVDVMLTPVVEDNNVVRLVRSPASTVSCEFDYQEFDNLYFADKDYFKDGLTADLEAAATEKFKTFNEIELPDINVLAISNLLFPERNALQLTDARLPGDLALFGHIDPKETSFTLDPLLPVVKAGEKQTFTIRQLGLRTQDVTWSVRSVDGSRSLGTIANGEYTAPAVQTLEGTAVRNVVTATYRDSATGKDVTASALVVVVLAGVVVTPSFSQIDMNDKRTVKLSGQAVSGAKLAWTLRGDRGTLAISDNEAVYTPPTTPLPEDGLEGVLIDVRDPDTGETAIATVLLSQGKFRLNMQPAFHPGLVEGGKALLTPPKPLQPNQVEWTVVAGQGQVDAATGLFTAPAQITSPYSVVLATFEDEFFDHYGYSIIHLNKHARQSAWLKLDVYDFEVMSSAPTVYANGLQQARVVVRVKPTDVDGVEVELSQSEFDSIRLVSADQHYPLPEVGTEGVPAGNKWYFNATENGYDVFPNNKQVVATKGGEKNQKAIQVKEFFVQCHKVEDLRIAASLVSDSWETHYSNTLPTDGESNSKVIKLIAVAPPEGGTGGNTLFELTGPDRKEGGSNENDLSTLDYYYLKLLIRGQQVRIKTIQFEGPCSLIRWESNSVLEDVHSITGYAVPGDVDEQGRVRLHTDEILARRMSGQAQLPPAVVDGAIPRGEVLFSLQRREYWQFDRYVKQDFSAPLNVTVYDVYGNKHNVRLDFEGTGRNTLKIVGQ